MNDYYGTNEELKSADYTTPSGSIILKSNKMSKTLVLMSSDCSFAKQINATIEKSEIANILDTSLF